MSGNNCNICRGVLPDYVDGKLDESEAQLLRLHLAASPECAAEEQRLRVLYTIALSRSFTVESIPEPGIFLTGINEGIDRKQPRFYGIARPALTIPVLAAVLLLVIAGAYFLDFSRPAGSGDTLFPGMLTAEDLRGLDGDAEIIPMLREVTIHDAAATEAEQILDAADDQDLPFLESEIASSLLGDIPYSSVVSESFDYVTPYDIVEDMEAGEFDDIVRTIENNRFILL